MRTALTLAVHALLLLPLVACEDPIAVVPTQPDYGSVQVCLDGGRPSNGDDVDVELDGTVTALDATLGDCTRSITVDDGAGTVVTLGLKVLSHEGVDITPDPGVAVGAEVHALYRYRMVWGDTAGLVISDVGGPLFAAEEGGWDGALAATDLEGVTVALGERTWEEETECEVRVGHHLVFTADDEQVLDPVGIGGLTVNGRERTAHAIQAWEWEESAGCDVSDNTDYTSWVITG